MIGRPAMVRRRPLLRAAAVGGTFAAGRAMGRRSEEQANAEATQDQPMGAVEGQQAASQQGTPPYQGGAPAAPAAAVHDAADGTSPVLDQLAQLSAMHEQGTLSDAEFAAAKAKVLGS
jgi:hypothetical protein